MFSFNQKGKSQNLIFTVVKIKFRFYRRKIDIFEISSFSSKGNFKNVDFTALKIKFRFFLGKIEKSAPAKENYIAYLGV